MKAIILSDKKMRDIGFTDHAKNRWYFMRSIKFPNIKEYRGFNISFNLTIFKDNSDIRIDILDEWFLQPYDYQYVLQRNPQSECANIVKKQVDKWLKYLRDKGVLNGYVPNEYI